MEMYIGENLDKANKICGLIFVKDADGHPLLLLDGRERRNPAYRRGQNATDGLYRVTRTEGSAPHDVSYYGSRVADSEAARVLNSAVGETPYTRDKDTGRPEVTIFGTVEIRRK